MKARNHPAPETALTETPNRRNVLGSLTGFLTGAFAGVVGHPTAAAASPAPVISPEEEEAIRQRILKQCCEQQDIPDGEDPGVHRAIVGLYDFLDNADEVLTRHKVEEGYCYCDFCEDFRGQFYVVSMFVSMLDGQTCRGGLLWRRKKLYDEKVKVREAFLRAYDATEVGDEVPDTGDAVLQIEPLKKTYCGKYQD